MKPTLRSQQVVKTSLSHPLQIAEVQVGKCMGKIGITFCPGKVQNSSFSGRWERDLRSDIEAIAKWDAAAVLTLLEPHEIEMLQVAGLADQVKRDQMIWRHAAIRDVSIPDRQFETNWQSLGPELRGLLENGFNVVVHCKGGLGRAGMISARLLVEMGWAPDLAVATVRSVRPGAIETPEQEKYVLRSTPTKAATPDTTREAIRDRAIGALVGLAVGDALGTTLEFCKRDNYDYLTDIVGGGPFSLEPGQWTDDTSMALALADSLQAGPDLNPRDLIGRFYDWFQNGRYSSNGHCFDIGTTTRAALLRWRESDNPFSGSTDPHTAGNGSLMRLSPVAIRFWHDHGRLRDAAASQSKTTHAAPAALDACKAFGTMTAMAIAGRTASELLSLQMLADDPSITSILMGSWRGKPRHQIHSSGYVAHSLEAAIWAVGRTGSFEEAVLLAANLGDDADTTAAIAGQLAGALYGAEGIPMRWRNIIHDQEAITETAASLFSAAFTEANECKSGGAL